METAPQSNASFTHVALLIEDLSMALLTTVETDGTLTNRPMAALEMDASGAHWFFTDLRSSQVEQRRVANLSFTDPERGTCVLLSGRVEIDTDRARISLR